MFLLILLILCSRIKISNIYKHGTSGRIVYKILSNTNCDIILEKIYKTSIGDKWIELGRYCNKNHLKAIQLKHPL